MAPDTSASDLRRILELRALNREKRISAKLTIAAPAQTRPECYPCADVRQFGESFCRGTCPLTLHPDTLAALRFEFEERANQANDDARLELREYEEES